MFQEHITLLNSSKYAQTYIRFIQSRLDLQRVHSPGVFERHHILPKSKSLFSQFSSFKEHPWNLVLLTPREHFVAHRLLAKCFDNLIQRRAMVFALHRFTAASKFVSSRQHEIARREFLALNKGETHPSFGLKMSVEARARMSASAPKTKSAEHRRKIGEANARRVWTNQSREKASVSASLKTLSIEHRASKEHFEQDQRFQESDGCHEVDSRPENRRFEGCEEECSRTLAVCWMGDRAISISQGFERFSSGTAISTSSRIARVVAT